MKFPFLRVKNSKGSIYYGMHFYPGVAEYAPEGKEAFRVFLNEDTIRAMDPSFAGRPVFVQHVDGVDDDVDELRKSADGWVIESFFNQADGKHWAKFIVCSERGEKAVASGMKLSNCYRATNLTGGGTWNGVSYAKEIAGGEFEHLAIVPNPRYEESVILTPDEFKNYNAGKLSELERLANDKGTKPMLLKFFKREKLENSADIETLVVALPKSGREVAITQLVNEADDLAVATAAAAGKPAMADGAMLVQVGETQMSVADLVAKYGELVAAAAAPVASVENEESDDADDVDAGDELENDDEDDNVDTDDSVENEDELEDKLDDVKTKNDAGKPAPKSPSKAAAKAKADALRNANSRAGRGNGETAVVEIMVDQVARGKSRYGS